eukprot:TRINITY_DN5314_c0_g1_i2.p2 TRINITY_DN5314_c0_g1~~TRINITY_DN5314_c0_g1_i2.p2  ORF type:complete len:358 (+),score=96.72 TRINITY_DN5314_c0_g1_i2:27-1076(+)
MPVLGPGGRPVLLALMVVGWAGWATFVAGFVDLADKSRFYSHRAYGSHLLFMIIAGLHLLLLLAYVARSTTELGLATLMASLFAAFTAGLALDKDGHSRELGFEAPGGTALAPCGGEPGALCRDLDLMLSGATVAAGAAVLGATALLVYTFPRSVAARSRLMALGVVLLVVGAVVFYVGFLSFVFANDSGRDVPDAGVHRGESVPAQYEIGEWSSAVVFSIAAGVVLVVAGAAVALLGDGVFVASVFCVVLCGACCGAAFHYLARVLDTGFRTDVWPPVVCQGLDSACTWIIVAGVGLVVFFAGLAVYLLACYIALTDSTPTGQVDARAHYSGIEWQGIFPKKGPLHAA